MAVPKVNLCQRKGKEGISYFSDFTINGQRQRLNAGTNKKTANEICQKKQAQLALGQFDLTEISNKVLSLDELVKNFPYLSYRLIYYS